MNNEQGNEISVLIEREESLRTFNIKPRLSEDVLNWQIGVAQPLFLAPMQKKQYVLE